MPPATRLLSSALQPLSRATITAPPSSRLLIAAAIHSNAPKPANVVPVYGTGPPPEPPVPAEEQVDSRVARRRRQAEMLKQAKQIRAAANTAAGAKKSGDQAGLLRKRFWQHVYIKEVDGAYEIHLDSRPLRRPETKEIVRIPLSKPNLAHALAVEWDHLTSAQQATKQHLTPLTSLVCRVLSIADDDAANSSAASPPAPIRKSIVTALLRYFDTDCLLCLNPHPSASDPASPAAALNAAGQSLRDVQEETLRRVSRYLLARVWPGLEIEPVLDDESLFPRSQRPGVREAVGDWVAGLEPWELAGLERATLAGKGLLGATRLLVEWSEGPAGAGTKVSAGDALLGEEEEGRFGVEAAARAASIEVDWQIRRWGEVEDTHDVEKEDIRRQLGSVVLLVSGTGSAKPRL